MGLFEALRARSRQKQAQKDAEIRAAAEAANLIPTLHPQHAQTIVAIGRKLGLHPSNVLNFVVETGMESAVLFRKLMQFGDTILQMQAEAIQADQAARAAEEAKARAAAQPPGADNGTPRCVSCRGLGTIKAGEKFIDCPTCHPSDAPPGATAEVTTEEPGPAPDDVPKGDA